MATVNKDFRIKAGLVVEGTTATVDGENIITTGSTTDSLPEGSTNVYYTEGRAKTDAAELLTGATLTNITITGDGNGLTITAENGGIQDLTGFDTDDLTEGTTNLYFTNQRALDATSAAYDAAGAAAAAQTAAEGYADTAIGALGTDDIEEGLTNLYFTNQRALDATSSAYDAAGAAAAAQTAAESYADGLASNYDAAGAAATAESNANSYTDTAVSNLVNGAPALLDTLNELAAAINNDESFSSTIATQIGEKQNTLTAGTNISIVSDTISVTGLSSTDISDFSTAALSATASAYDASGAASSAETAANGYTDTAISGLSSVYEPLGAASSAVDALTTDDIEEGLTNLYFSDSRAIDAVSAADIYPNAVIVNNVSKTVANAVTASTASTVSGLTWAKADYRSAKLVVKAETATHSQVSEIMVTLDSSDNVAITEFGIVYTDVELATVTADVSGTDVRIRVTTLNASTNVMVVGTLLI